MGGWCLGARPTSRLQNEATVVCLPACVTQSIGKSEDNYWGMEMGHGQGT